MADFDLFSLLGVEAPQEPKKEPKKAPKKEGKKDNNKKEEKVKLPAKLVIPYAPIEDGFAVEGKSEVTLSELQKAVEEKFSWLPEAITTAYMSKGAVVCTYKPELVQAKGSLGVDEVVFGDLVISLSGDRPDSGYEIEAVNASVDEAVPVLRESERGYILRDGKAYLVLLGEDSLEEDSFGEQEAVSVLLPGVEEFVVNKTDAESFLADAVSESLEKYGDVYSPVLRTIEGEISVVLVVKPPKKAAAASGKKETKYDISKGDVELSLQGLCKLPLAPDKFGGKCEVTADDIINYILSEKHVEFSKERTTIEKVNDSLLIAILKSSTKGALVTYEEFLSAGCTKGYALCDIPEGGHVYRCEYTPVGIYRMCYANPSLSAFYFFLPKVPLSCFVSIGKFFSYVAEKYDTEAAVQLFWDKEDKKYVVYVPTQTVSEASVTFERNIEWECGGRYVLVADIHSHGKIPAFFSSVDNADEKGTRIFGVYGGLGSEKASILLRAGSGGQFLNLPFLEVFNKEYDASEEEDLLIYLDRLTIL